MMARMARVIRLELDARERRAARDAGAWGLALFAAGVNVVGFVVGVAVVLAVLRTIVLEIFGTLPGEVGVGVQRWVDGLDLTLLAWLAAAAIVVAIGLGWAGVATSTRILRGAGLEPARRITWVGCLLGTMLQLALGVMTSWLLGLLWLLAGLVAPWLLLLFSLALSLTASTLIGYLAGPVLWRRRVVRHRLRAGAAAGVGQPAARSSLRI